MALSPNWSWVQGTDVLFYLDSLISVPGLADVGVPHGGEDGSRTQAPGSGSKMAPYHIDQWEILKAWEG